MKAQLIQDKLLYIVSAEDGTYVTFSAQDKDRALELYAEKAAEAKPK